MHKSDDGALAASSPLQAAARLTPTPNRKRKRRRACQAYCGGAIVAARITDKASPVLRVDDASCDANAMVGAGNDRTESAIPLSLVVCGRSAVRSARSKHLPAW